MWQVFVNSELLAPGAYELNPDRGHFHLRLLRQHLPSGVEFEAVVSWEARRVDVFVPLTTVDVMAQAIDVDVFKVVCSAYKRSVSDEKL